MAECTVSGGVTLVEDAFGPDADGYLIADRVVAPASYVTDDPAFAALIGVAVDAGSTLSITFTIDVDFGFPTDFVGTTSVTGAVTLLAGGDIGVDGATLPNEVIDDASRATLTEAAGLGVDATVIVTGTGNLQVKSDIPELTITLAVSYETPAESEAPSAVPSPSGNLLPDTSADGATGPVGPGIAVLLGLMVVAGAGLWARAVVVSRRR